MAMEESHGALQRAGAIELEPTPGGDGGGALRIAAARRRTRREIRLAPRRVHLLSLGAALVLLTGAWVTHEVAEKLVDLRYRLQLLEARQDSLGQREGAAAEHEQAMRGAAGLPKSGQPSPFLKGAWEKIGGSGVVPGWPDDYSKTKALAVHEDRLYVGLARPNQGAPQIWRFDGAVWEKVGSAEIVPAWSRHSYVSALVSDGATLYAAIDDTVWAHDARQGWRQIGGDGRAGSWTRGNFTNAYALALYRGRLVAGMSGGTEAAVYSYGLGGWQKIAGAGDVRHTGVYELWSHTDGFLYAGLIARPGPTAVMRYDGARWEKIGGDGVNGSWRNAGFTHALSFASLNGRLVVSMNRHPMVVGNFSSVWSFDGKAWQPVGLDHIPPLWGHMHSYNAVAAYAGRLVIGAGGHPAGNASVWEIADGTRPVMVGGHGLKGSWGGNEAWALGLSSAGNMDYVYRLVTWRGDLVAGFGDDPGSAAVWRYRWDRGALPKESPARH
jgi:hypothetical protein